MFANRGIIRLHGVLRHPVPPAPVVSATRGWLFQEPEFRCGPLLTSNKPPSITYMDSDISFPSQPSLRKNVPWEDTNYNTSWSRVYSTMQSYQKSCCLSVGRV